MKSLTNFIAAFALIFYPCSVLVGDQLSGLLFIVVLLYGLTGLIIQYKKVFPLLIDEKLFFIAVSTLLVTAIITTLYKDAHLARADRFLALLFVIPVYVFFRYSQVKEKYIWLGLIAGSFIALSFGAYQVFGPAHQPRATGVIHPILFGDLSLIMGVLSLAGLGWFMQRKKWMLFLPVMAFVAGLLASVLSLSRGGWVALPFLSLVFIWYLSRHLSIRKITAIFSLLFVAVSIIYFVPQLGVQERVGNTFSNIQRYYESNDANDPARSTSIGLRFEMWKAAWSIFKDNPVFGAGWGDYTEKAQGLVDKGLLNKGISNFYHPHNQFISALAKGGILAFVALSTLFMLPLFIFYRSLRDYPQAEIQRAALAGLILVVGFVSFGLSEAILERSRPIIFFSFYLAVFMAMVQRYRQENI